MADLTGARIVLDVGRSADVSGRSPPSATANTLTDFYRPWDAEPSTGRVDSEAAFGRTLPTAREQPRSAGGRELQANPMPRSGALAV